MGKVFFSTDLTPDNIKLRDYLISQISEFMNMPESDLLDIGCGNGRFAVLLAEKIKSYTGIDPDKEYIEYANKNIKIKNAKFKVGRGEKIGLENKFDIVLYSFSWHYIQNYENAIEELEKVIKKNGIVVILEPPLKPRGYAIPKLNKSSPEFSLESWQKKLKNLKIAQEALKKQDKFKVVRFEEEGKRLWILKPIKDSYFRNP